VPLTIAEIDHVVLRVTDVDRAIRFYSQVLGCVMERRIDELGLYQLRAGRALIDLVDVAAPLGRAGGSKPGEGARNLDHFCVRIEPFDEDEIRRVLQENGVDAGPTERRYGAQGTGPSIYIRDPDGNVVELKGPTES
jgi:catechol 2,3-dioxygenase-like lactoylglutathione lyase family enzyme